MTIPRKTHLQRGQWSLIGTLVSVAILIALAAFYLPHLLKPAAGPDAQEATVMRQADSVACSEYLSQLNQAAQSYKMDHDGQPPRALDDLKKYGVTDDMIHSPGCAFQVDPATGSVTNGPPTAPAAGQPPPSGGTRGPGGVTIPNIPNAGGGMYSNGQAHRQTLPALD